MNGKNGALTNGVKSSGSVSNGDARLAVRLQRTPLHALRRQPSVIERIEDAVAHHQSKPWQVGQGPPRLIVIDNIDSFNTVFMEHQLYLGPLHDLSID